MPFGLTNVPATFQRLMESCLGELHLEWCIIYLDDIIIFSKNPDDHLTHLEGVFERLAKAGLKLKPSKCEFFRRGLKYLGHIVSKNGIATDPGKVKAIQDWPKPKTVTEVRSFTGFTNYYRCFIKGYAKVARPLHELTSGENGKKKHSKVQWNERCCTVPFSLFADPERILRRLYVFVEEPCKSTNTTSEPCSPVFKEAQPRPSEHSNLEYHINNLNLYLYLDCSLFL